MSEHHFDVSLEDFETEVLEASMTVPVLVDFWAEWCGPCKTLKPLLEKLADAYQGRFRLAKVDSDKNPELAQYFGVRSIPTVVLIQNGQPVDGFTGARPEAEIRAFLDRFVAPPAADPRAEAAACAQVGDWEGALARLAPLRAAHPEDEGIRLDAATALLELGRTDEARALLALEYPQEVERAQALRTRLALSEHAVDTAPLLARLAANPDDHASRLELARAYAAAGNYDQAMAEALEVVRRDRFFDAGAGRRLLLEFFTALSGNPQHDDRVRHYRRALSALLH